MNSSVGVAAASVSPALTGGGGPAGCGLQDLQLAVDRDKWPSTFRPQDGDPAAGQKRPQRCSTSMPPRSALPHSTVAIAIRPASPAFPLMPNVSSGRQVAGNGTLAQFMRSLARVVVLTPDRRRSQVRTFASDRRAQPRSHSG